MEIQHDHEKDFTSRLCVIQAYTCERVYDNHIPRLVGEDQER